MNIYHRDFLPCLAATGLRHVTFHAFRHTFASLLLQRGASLHYVKEQLGHSSIQVTVDIYGHLVPGGDIGWIDQLDSQTSLQPAATQAQAAAEADPIELLEIVEMIGGPTRNSNLGPTDYEAFSNDFANSLHGRQKTLQPLSFQ